MGVNLENPPIIVQAIDYYSRNDIYDHYTDTNFSGWTNINGALPGTGEGVGSSVRTLNDSWLVGGDVTINLQASDIKTIQYFIDTVPITGVISASQKVVIHTTNYTNGRHYLRAVVTNTSNQTTTFPSETLVVINLSGASSMPSPTPSPTSTPTPTPASIPGDLNGDGKVDNNDYKIFKSNFGKTGAPGWISSDINKDGKVNLFDYTILVGNFGK